MIFHRTTMSPNTGSQPTPLPSTSATTPSTPLSQPPISSFISRAGETARNSISNAMSINRNILDPSDIDILISSDSDSDNPEEMDLSLNRKRDRDSNEDTDNGHSSSMITNTSLLPDQSDNPPRCTRLSGISSPQNSPPPATLQQEMAQVRQHAALQNLQHETSTPIVASLGADLSSVSNELRLVASLDGVRLLTRQAVGFPDNAP
jgi:hypothetical protein